jgi:hypothetical protein
MQEFRIFGRKVTRRKWLYFEFRQRWLGQEFVRLRGHPAVCETCRAVADFIHEFLWHGRKYYKYANNLLTTGHRQGRYSHPEKVMIDEGVGHQCWKCNGNQSGANYKEGEPQWKDSKQETEN